MMGKAHPPLFLEDFFDGIVDRLSGLLINNSENAVQRFSFRLIPGPPGHAFGFQIHESDQSIEIGHDDRIPDAGKGHPKSFLLVHRFEQGCFVGGGKLLHLPPNVKSGQKNHHGQGRDLGIQDDLLRHIDLIAAKGELGFLVLKK